MEEAIRFADWIKNNWFIPKNNGDSWKLDMFHDEFQPTMDIEHNRFYTTEQLWDMFKSGKGEF